MSNKNGGEGERGVPRHPAQRSALIFVHLFINIGMSVGVTPITGLPLPFLSYGGSFVMSMMLALGFMQSVYRRNITAMEEDRVLKN